MRQGVRPKCPVHSPGSNLVRKPGSCPRSPFPRGAGARSLLSGPAGPLPALTGYSPSPPPRRLSPPGGCPHAAAAPAPPSWTPSPARSPLPRTPLPARRRLPQRSRLRPLLAAFRLLRAPRSAPPAPLDAPRPTHGGALSSYRGAAAERPRAQRLTPPHGSRAGPPAWPRPRRRGWGPAPGPASLPGLGPSVTGPASVSSARDPLAAHGTPLLPRLHDASEHNPKAPEAPPSLTPAPGTAAGLRPSPAPAGDPQRHLPSPHSAPARAHQATCAVPAWASARTTSGDAGLRLPACPAPPGGRRDPDRARPPTPGVHHAARGRRDPGRARPPTPGVHHAAPPRAGDTAPHLLKGAGTPSRLRRRRARSGDGGQSGPSGRLTWAPPRGRPCRLGRDAEKSPPCPPLRRAGPRTRRGRNVRRFCTCQP